MDNKRIFQLIIILGISFITGCNKKKSNGDGKVSKMNPSTGSIVFSATINEVVSLGEGGLLGMALHPDFLSNGFLYIVYNYNSPNGYREKLVRYSFSNNSITNLTTLIENIAASSIHNGSRIRVIN